MAQAVGIGLADREWLQRDAALLLGLLAALSGVVVACSGRARRALLAIAAVVALAAGALSLSVRLDAAASWPLQSTELTLEGSVGAAASGPGWVRVDLVDVVAVDPQAPEPPERIRLMGSGGPPGIRGLEGELRGTRVRARVRLRALHAARNPGVRPQRRRWERAGIGAVGSLVDTALYVALAEHGPVGPVSSFRALRRRVSQRLSAAGDGSALVRALALGDRGGLTLEMREVFRRVGLSHLLAVSGLHLTLVASLVFAILHSTTRRCASLAARFDTRKMALAGGLAAAVFYALFAGWGIPVRRALVLVLALALAVVRARPGLRTEPFALAAIAILAVEPGALFEPGAQMSFAAAGALVMASRRPDCAERIRPRFLIRVTSDGLRASASAIAATAPLAAWQLGSVAPIGLAANVVAIPWTAFVLLPSALAATVAASCGIDPAAAWLARAAARASELTLDMARLLASAVPVPAPTGQPGLFWVAVVVLLVFATLRARRTAARVAFALAVGGMLQLAPTKPMKPNPPRLIALEVGQGSSIIVQGRDAVVLVDAGGATAAMDWGRRAVIPALAALGIDHLDLVVISHGDLDHRGGIPTVLAEMSVGEVWIPFGTAADPALAPVYATARARGVRVFERGEGSPQVALGELDVTVLWPPPDSDGGSRNNRSLVVRIEVAGHRILLPGDLEAGAERKLLDRGADLGADVLVLAHHGSRSSSTSAFLSATDASIAIAAAPCGGRFGLPHQTVLERAREAQLSVWWTGREGAVLAGLGDPLVVWGMRDHAGARPARCRSGPRSPNTPD